MTDRVVCNVVVKTNTDTVFCTVLQIKLLFTYVLAVVKATKDSALYCCSKGYGRQSTLYHTDQSKAAGKCHFVKYPHVVSLTGDGHWPL